MIKMLVSVFLILVCLSGCNRETRIQTHTRAKTDKKPVSQFVPHNGDIIFQISRSSQSTAIQIATKSKYSHVGIIYSKDGEYYVFEASRTAKLTPLSQWIAIGVNNHYVVKRLTNAKEILTTNALNNMYKEGQQLVEKPYDLYFEWSDKRMYCSELVWKIYKRALGIEIGKLQKLRDFDLSSPIVAKKVKERFGTNPPLDETVISPVSIFDSHLLTTVFEN